MNEQGVFTFKSSGLNELINSFLPKGFVETVNQAGPMIATKARALLLRPASYENAAARIQNGIAKSIENIANSKFASSIVDKASEFSDSVVSSDFVNNISVAVDEAINNIANSEVAQNVADKAAEFGDNVAKNIVKAVEVSKERIEALKQGNFEPVDFAENIRTNGVKLANRAIKLTEPMFDRIVPTAKAFTKAAVQKVGNVVNAVKENGNVRDAVVNITDFAARAKENVAERVDFVADKANSVYEAATEAINNSDSLEALKDKLLQVKAAFLEASEDNKKAISMEDAARAALKAANDRKEQAAERMSKMIDVLRAKVGELNDKTAKTINAANRFYGQAEESDRITRENNLMAAEVEKMIGGENIIDFSQNVEEAEIGHAKVA